MTDTTTATATVARPPTPILSVVRDFLIDSNSFYRLWHLHFPRDKDGHCIWADYVSFVHWNDSVLRENDLLRQVVAGLLGDLPDEEGHGKGIQLMDTNHVKITKIERFYIDHNKRLVLTGRD